MLENFEMVSIVWFVYYAVSAGIIYLCYRLSAFLHSSNVRIIILLLFSAMLFTPWYYMMEGTQHIAPALFISLYEAVAISITAGLRSVFPIFAVFIILIACLSFLKIVYKATSRSES